MVFVKKFVLHYLPAILWSGVIFYLSSISGLKTGAESFFWEVLLRKLAHVFEYIFLSWLIWRILYDCHKFSIAKSFFYSALIVLIFALSDELHQVFVDGRAGRMADIAVDFSAAISVLGFIAAGEQPDREYLRVYRNRKRFGWFSLGIVFAVATIWIILSLGKQAQLKQDGQSGIFGTDSIEKDQAEFAKDAANSEDKEDGYSAEPDKIIQRDLESGDSLADNIAKQDSEKTGPIPDSILIEVPFTSQAPFANWDDVHEESCEEASLIMVKYALSGDQLTGQVAEAEIQKMKDFQLERYGFYEDSSMRQLKQLAEDFYGMDNLKIVYDFKKDEIKKQLSQGSILILPAAGRKLGNPNFTPPGPLYHNLVAIGYDGNKIITNDPGTRKGKKYIYDLDILYEAIHDFPGKKEDIEKGKKAMIVVSLQ